MIGHRLTACILLMIAAGVSPAASAQGRPDSAALMAAQREAMTRLAFLHGVWRGPAVSTLPSGDTHTITQTERIGRFLDGSVTVIEGRGYEPDGKVGFNALAIVSYGPDTRAYSMRSYALGNVGDFVFTLTPEGFAWEIPAGPMTLRYTAVVKNGTWHEVGDRIAPGKEPVRFFDMTLARVGDTDWPAAGAISPK